MYIQGASVFELEWDGLPKSKGGKNYGDIFQSSEMEYSKYNFELADTEILRRHFGDAETGLKIY